jgi:hypothetical protein
MTWAFERRLIVWVVIGGILAVFAALFYYGVFYRAPSCIDGIKDGKETGLDCGGTCPYLCTADEQEPTVLFTKAILNGEGRTDVIALIENKNQEASKDAPYEISVFGFDQRLIQHLTGTVDLPPSTTVPIFIPGIASGQATPGSSFLTIDASSTKWYTLAPDPRILPKVSNITPLGATSSPRITATLTNADVRGLRNIKTVAVVKNAAGNVIAASQTIVKNIPPQGSVEATFTWNAPFTDKPASIQVYPVVPLPPAP